MSVRVTVIFLPDCTTENVSTCVSVPNQLLLLTVAGHVCNAESIIAAFDPPALLPTTAKEQSDEQGAWEVGVQEGAEPCRGKRGDAVAAQPCPASTVECQGVLRVGPILLRGVKDP